MARSTRELANLAGTTVNAVQHYHRLGLLEEPQKPQPRGRQRFATWVVRFGVPGASILGPLAIPTQFTSAMLVASGTPKGWVLLWQGIAIVL